MKPWDIVEFKKDYLHRVGWDFYIPLYGLVYSTKEDFITVVWYFPDNTFQKWEVLKSNIKLKKEKIH
jgi:hypothetical protein